jgi:hypothetical protein
MSLDKLAYGRIVVDHQDQGLFRLLEDWMRAPIDSEHLYRLIPSSRSD